MTSKEWKRKIGILAVAVALLCVVNPELRALLLLVDALSLEAFLLLVAFQLKGIWPLVQPIIGKLVTSFARLSVAALRHLSFAINALNPRVPMALLAKQTLWAAQSQLTKVHQR